MDNKSRVTLTTILNATFLLTLATGISYMLGYLYWEGFYAHFGISIRILELSKEDFLLYGSLFLLLPSLLLTGILLLLYWTINLPNDKSNNLFQFLKKLLDKFNQLNHKLYQLNQWIKKQLHNLYQWLRNKIDDFFQFHWIFWLAILLIIIVLLFFYPSRKIYDLGGKAGSQYAFSAPLTEVVYKDETATVKKKSLGLLTISKGAYFFFELVNKVEDTPKVIILQKESLVSVTIIGKVKDYKQ